MTMQAEAPEPQEPEGFDPDDPLHVALRDIKTYATRLKQGETSVRLLQREISGNVYDIVAELAQQLILLRDGTEENVNDLWEAIEEPSSRLMPEDATKVTALIAFTEMLIEHVRAQSPSAELEEKLEQGVLICKGVQELVEEALVLEDGAEPGEAGAPEDAAPEAT